MSPSHTPPTSQPPSPIVELPQPSLLDQSSEGRSVEEAVTERRIQYGLADVILICFSLVDRWSFSNAQSVVRVCKSLWARLYRSNRSALAYTNASGIKRSDSSVHTFHSSWSVASSTYVVQTRKLLLTSLEWPDAHSKRPRCSTTPQPQPRLHPFSHLTFRRPRFTRAPSSTTTVTGQKPSPPDPHPSNNSPARETLKVTPPAGNTAQPDDDKHLPLTPPGSSISSTQVGPRRASWYGRRKDVNHAQGQPNTSPAATTLATPQAASTPFPRTGSSIKTNNSQSKRPSLPPLIARSISSASVSLFNRRVRAGSISNAAATALTPVPVSTISYDFNHGLSISQKARSSTSGPTSPTHGQKESGARRLSFRPTLSHRRTADTIITQHSIDRVSATGSGTSGTTKPVVVSPSINAPTLSESSDTHETQEPASAPMIPITTTEPTPPIPVTSSGDMVPPSASTPTNVHPPSSSQSTYPFKPTIQRSATSYYEALKMAQALGAAGYIECSARTLVNVVPVFEEAVRVAGAIQIFTSRRFPQNNSSF